MAMKVMEQSTLERNLSNTTENKSSSLTLEVDWRTSSFSEIKVTKYYAIYGNMIRKLMFLQKKKELLIWQPQLSEMKYKLESITVRNILQWKAQMMDVHLSLKVSADSCVALSNQSRPS